MAFLFRPERSFLLLVGSMRIGINGFGRIGRLVFRALWGRSHIELVHINDPAGDAPTAAHLLEFDSVHGRWDQHIDSDLKGIKIDGQFLSYSQESDPTNVPWEQAGVDFVLECSGKIKTPDLLNPYFDQCGIKRVVVACPVTGEVAGTESLNIVMESTIIFATLRFIDSSQLHSVQPIAWHQLSKSSMKVLALSMAPLQHFMTSRIHKCQLTHLKVI